MPSPDPVDPRVEAIARRFHEAYERLAPAFGYETRRESAVAWEDVPEPNRSLMLAVAGVVLDALPSDRAERVEVEAWLCEKCGIVDEGQLIQGQRAENATPADPDGWVDEFYYTEEPADPDDPIIAGPRFKRERDELRAALWRIAHEAGGEPTMHGYEENGKLVRIIGIARRALAASSEHPEEKA